MKRNHKLVSNRTFDRLTKFEKAITELYILYAHFSDLPILSISYHNHTFTFDFGIQWYCCYIVCSQRWAKLLSADFFFAINNITFFGKLSHESRIKNIKSRALYRFKKIGFSPFIFMCTKKKKK
jgi:hypothetical protein